MEQKYLDIIAGSGGACFLEDTKVLTPAGLIEIKTIKAGDEVISFDDKGNLLVAKVLSTNSHTNKEVYRFNLWGGGHLDATPNHWVLNADNSFVEIGKVDESMSLVNASGFLTPIVSKELLGTFTVYNFIVEGYHTYIANGIRVHNGGGGKSGSSHVPSEQPDTLHSKTYAKVLDLICEGEIEGLVSEGRSIYFDGTPLMNADGSYNFKDVTWDLRTGTQDQTPIDGFDEVEAEHSLNTEITTQISPVISVVDPTVDKVRLALAIPSLYEQESDGDLVASSVSYQVYLQKNGNTGDGAIAAVGTIANGVIYSVPITNGGQNYPTAGTTISISGAGTSAAITPVVTNGTIKTVTLNNAGSGYTYAHAVISGDGTGAELVVDMGIAVSWGDEITTTSVISGIRVTKPGSGYTKASVIIYGDGAGAIATANIVNGVITALNITNGGQDYTTTTTFTATGSGGSAATFGTPTINNGVIKTISVVSAGANYSVAPLVTISDINNTGVGALATASISGGTVTGIPVTNGGKNYVAANTVVTVTAGGFEPVSLTPTASEIEYLNTFSIYDVSFERNYIGVSTGTTGIVALIKPYLTTCYNDAIYMPGIPTGSICAPTTYRWQLEYREAYSNNAFTVSSVGGYFSLEGTPQAYFRWEEVKEAYAKLKATNPSITLTYAEYILSRLNAISPDAPENIKTYNVARAGIYGYIIPIPYYTYKIEGLPAKNYEFRCSVSAIDEENPYSVNYNFTDQLAILSPNVYFTTVGQTIVGKTTSKYTINHTITLPRTSESDSFNIKVVRLTPDSDLSTLQNKLFFESYATIVSSKLRYPNSALFGIKIDSENFNTIPTRGYHLKLAKIKIPDNYNPITGLYNRRTKAVPAATNLLTYSESFDNAAWTKQTNVTVISDITLAPDGKTPADRINWTSATTNTGILQNGKVVSTSLTNTKSIWVRADTAGGQIGLCDPNQTIGETLHTLSTAWTRISLAEVQTGGLAGLWIRKKATSPTSIYIYGGQLEQNGSATDYIRTESVPVTRPIQPIGSLAYDVVTGEPVEQLWTGDFYTAWSNNPAWCFYDLITNARYGLGEYIDANYIDEYTLYSIGKYCDELVPNGYGGYERRFTLNAYIQTRQEAIKLLQDMASVFRGIIYWSSGLITAVQDAAGATPVYQFNNSNVIDGEFNYTGASRKAIHNATMVSWNDPLLQFRQRVEYVEDRDAIDKYGYNPTEIVAFGCTSRGQAHRTGKALLYTEQVENNLVSFKAALDASYIRPGLLIKVQDDTRSGTLVNGNIVGGRVVSIVGNNIVLDRTVNINAAGTKIRLNSINTTPDINKGFTDYLKTAEFTLTQTSGDFTTVTSSTTIADTNLGPNTIWSILPPTESEELFKVLAIKESDDMGIYEIVGMLHNPSKYAYIEQNLQLEAYSYSTLDNIPTTPTFTVDTNSVPLRDDIYLTNSGIIQSYLNIAFNRSLYAVKYDIYLKKDVDDWVLVAKDISTTSYTVYGVKDSSVYRVKVVAKNFLGKESQPGYYPPLAEAGYTVLGKTRKPSDVTGFNASIIDNGNIEFTWNAVADVDLNVYELRTNTNWGNPTGLLTTIKATSFVTAATIVGTNTYYIKALDTSNLYSENAASDSLTILVPSTPVLNTTTVDGTNLTISWNDCTTTLPIKYYHIYKDTTATAAATVGNVLSYIAPISWAGSNIYIRAEDIAGNLSSISTSNLASITAPTISTHSTVVSGTLYNVNLTISAGNMPLGGVEVKYGGASWESPEGTLDKVSGSLVTIPITWGAGTSRLFRFKAIDIIGTPSDEYTVNLTVTAPATPSISSPTFLNIDNTVKISWNDCKTTLPIDYYEVRQGADWASGKALGKFYGLEAILPVDWASASSYYFVKARDVNGNEGSIGSILATPSTWGVITFANPQYSIVDSNCILHWNKPVIEGSFTFSHYNIYHTAVNADNFIDSATTGSLSIPVDWVNTSKTFYVEVVDSKGNKNTPVASSPITISYPVPPVIDGPGCGFLLDQFTIKWVSVPPSATTLGIQEYEVGYYTDYGTTNQAAVSLGRVKGTVFSGKADWGGTRTFWVKSIDILGNVGTSVNETQLQVTSPGAISAGDIEIQVVDNNVLLYWKEPVVGTLPVLTYEIREGIAWDDIDVREVGTKTGNFTTIFETNSGDFTYWIVAIDTAGNIGTPISVSSRVNQPPDYILKADDYADFNGPNVVKSNALVDGNILLLPVNTTETWQNHFTSRNWTSPQDQITDNFPLYIQPSMDTSYFEDVIDYGTILAANKITITPTRQILEGNPSTVCDIYTSPDNSTWTGATNVWALYATNFRYVKYRITATGAKLGTYTQSGTTATITCTAHELIASDTVFLDFTSGGGANTYDNTYTVSSVDDENAFKVIGVPSGSASGSVAVYNSSKFSGIVKLDKINIRLDSKLKTLTGTIPVRSSITGATYSHSSFGLTVTKTSHGVTAGEIIELDYGLTGATYVQTGTSVVVTKTAHGFLATEKVTLDFTSGSAGIPYEDYFTITAATDNYFTVTSTQTIASTSGNVTIGQPFVVQSTTSSTITLTNVVSKTASGSTNIDNKGTIVFMTLDRTMNTAREYIDVDAISLSVNSATPLISMYDFADKPDPWYFRILVFNTSGTATSASACSYTIRGF